MEFEVYEREEACIQVASLVNEDMDCIFFVQREEKEQALRVLQKAWDDFWDQQCEPFGDFLTSAMKEAGIAYEVYYKSSSADQFIPEVSKRKTEEVRNIPLANSNRRTISR